jgi:signal transduction histidine kinase
MHTASRYISRREFKPNTNSYTPGDRSRNAAWRARNYGTGFPGTFESAGSLSRMYADKTDLMPAETNRRLSLLWAATSHDIRNQLTGLMGYLSLAGHASPGPAAGAYLAKAHEMAGAIAHQIEFASTYQEIGLKTAGWQDISDVVAGVVARAPHDPDAVRVALDHVEIFADPMLWQVFSNLIDNALRHGKSVNEIHIFGAESPDSYTIIVVDDGIGVPAGEKEKIFGKGYGNNTGLGLFLIREILAITGISIRETGRPGRGARFEITVPGGRYRFPSRRSSG